MEREGNSVKKIGNCENFKFVPSGLVSIFLPSLSERIQT
jgi:hypothetical protein